MAPRKKQAATQPAKKQHKVVLTERQQSVINNHIAAIKDLDSRLYTYLRGLADGNDIPENFRFAGIDAKGAAVFVEAPDVPQPA